MPTPTGVTGSNLNTNIIVAFPPDIVALAKLKSETSAETRLDVLAREAISHLASSLDLYKQSARHAFLAGKNLFEARGLLKVRKGWEGWVKEHVRISKNKANQLVRLYIALKEHPEKIDIFKNATEAKLWAHIITRREQNNADAKEQQQVAQQTTLDIAEPEQSDPEQQIARMQSEIAAMVASQSVPSAETFRQSIIALVAMMNKLIARVVEQQVFEETPAMKELGRMQQRQPPHA